MILKCLSTSSTSEKSLKADKNGLRNFIYYVNGNKYKGEWKNNNKHGIVL